MKKRLGRVAVVLVLIALLCSTLFGAFACQKQASVRTLYALGAVLKMVSYEGMEDWYVYAQTLVHEVEQAVDVDHPRSDLARFNAADVGESVAVSALCADMLQVAHAAYLATQGGYDPAAYWLVDGWGFSPKAQNEASRPTPPDRDYVAALLGVSCWDSVAFDYANRTLVKHDSVTYAGDTYTTCLDLGGIAKGWVVRCLYQKAAELGVERGYVSFGTSSVALLANAKDGDWDLSLTHPRKAGQTYCTMPCSNMCLATSGDYENYYEYEGKRYCHLLDTSTGYPIDNGVCCVTVLGKDAALCDALATGLCVKGMDFIRAFATGDYARANGLDVVAVYQTQSGLACYSTLTLDTTL